jgi:amino acid adenylation domain-containing protein
MAADSITARLLGVPTAWHARTAFASPLGELGFGTLRDGALRFAAWLKQEAGLRPGDRVAICLPRSLEAVQVVFGVLAAGGAYVPLPFLGPTHRLQALTESVEPRLLVATAEVNRRLFATGCKLPPVAEVISQERGTGLAALLAHTPASAATDVASAGPRPDDAAGIFFTSGSTGEPKGVMLSHRSMGAVARWVSRWNAATPADRLMSDAGLHYATSFDLFTPLFAGCRTFVLPDREAMFPERVAEVMERAAVTVWCSSATSLRLLFDSGELARRDVPRLRRVEFFGEPLSTALLRRLMACLPKAEFVNFYGATEAHRIASYDVPRPLPENIASLPVGRPTDNYAVSLRDEAGGELPAGEIGEICVTGPAALTGYWRDPALTAAKRIGGAQSYRTGDLGRLGADGLLRLVGRKDQLVKLRGNRFDLGEVEAVLRADGAVDEAVAFALPGRQGELEVFAAVQGADGPAIEVRLRRLATERLPRFAQPARIAVLARFPLLPTGKIDRQALKRLLSSG